MLEGGEQAVWGVAKYEEEYVREDGEWKIRNLILAPECWTPFEQGWVNQQFIGTIDLIGGPLGGPPAEFLTEYHRYVIYDYL